ncbi:MAG: MFS transporter [Pseudomonadales bacterium]|nr:MFS transporter [Pseudomonadales bacterium]MDP7360022.1 MFS transporter [Pseudomonadales bacterium]MDP7598095.1 MFS transporter [Pseudomonadales bacterium]HJN49408.1 MFS transporter [Pseudomonadales bacterium]
MSTKASKVSIFFYGFGNLSPAIKGNFLGAPIFYYYNNVLGLEAWLVSLALALALVIDGITDPLVGYMSDHTRSRFGRRHPYIYASVLPGALCYFFLIMANFGTSQSATAKSSPAGLLARTDLQDIHTMIDYAQLPKIESVQVKETL